MATKEICDACTHCNKDMHLIYSKLGLPYWVHKVPTNKCKDVFPHTPEMNIVAKNLLFRHLINRGGLLIKSYCDICCDRAEVHLSSLASVYKKDYTYQSLTLDVVALDKQDNIQHCTYHNVTFDIAALDEQGNFLTGYNFWFPGRERTNTNLFHFEIQAIEILSNLTKQINIITGTSISTIHTCNKEYCLPMYDISLLLGYITPHIYYTNEVQKIVDEVDSKYNTLNWNNIGNIKKSKNINKICIKCQVGCPVRFKQPFCKSCLDEVSTIPT
jgi:hypothetical protein